MKKTTMTTRTTSPLTMTNSELREALKDVQEKIDALQEQANSYENVLAERSPCSSSDPDWQCRGCRCWKYTRELCG